MTVESVNFDSSNYNNISTLPEQSGGQSKDSSTSIGTNPGPSLIRSESTQDQMQQDTVEVSQSIVESEVSQNNPESEPESEVDFHLYQ